LQISGVRNGLRNLGSRHGSTIVFLATVMAMAVNFGGSVLNTRMLSKASFGDWKFIQSYLFFISYIVNFGVYQSGQRLIAKTEDPKRIQLFKGYLIYATLIGWLVMLLLTVVAGFFKGILSSHIFYLLLIHFPLFVMHPLMFYFESVYQAEKKMIRLALYRVLPPVMYVLSLLMTYRLSTGNVAMNILLYYGTYLLAFIMLFKGDRIRFGRKSEELRLLLAENKSFGLHIYYGSLAGVGTAYLLPLLVGFLGINNSGVGQYSLALTFITPLALLPAVTGASHYRSFAHVDRIPGSLVKRTVLLSFFICATVVLLIDYIVDWVFGPAFKDVATLVQIGALAGVLHGFGDFINKFLHAKGKGVQIRNVAILAGIVQLGSSLALIYLLAEWGAIIARGMGSLTYFVSLLYIYRKSLGYGQIKFFGKKNSG
jgi:Membrane protein involved in the export of O-antigen and teichoic acid